jgi:hypothetical protein
VVFSTNKTDRHNITEVLLKVVLSTIHQSKIENYERHTIEQLIVHLYDAIVCFLLIILL